jgi:hypothetical protein
MFEASGYSAVGRYAQQRQPSKDLTITFPVSQFYLALTYSIHLEAIIPPTQRRRVLSAFPAS